MSESVQVALIGLSGTVLSIIVVPLAIWAFRQWRTNRKTKSTAIKTVQAWEETVDRKNEQLDDWERRFNKLYDDFTRTREILRDQDIRMARKDERIAHLERLCDSKGKPS